ncbi:hypothetical protein [Treponema primitia]|uniref:hypothetical protein n=1 Tax=Treponema primitia TaxID=88058 RepID=UPI000255528A|nr:hypothetical protein [Treponema primitia]
MFGKKNVDPDEFWKKYEAALGEKVHSYALGQYLSGWPEYDYPLWGLLIATSGGFRFHHFPHEGWLQVLSRASTGGDPPKEKTLFIPRDHILQAELRVEKSLFKRIFFAKSPLFVLRYTDSTGAEAEFIAEADAKVSGVVEELSNVSTSI